QALERATEIDPSFGVAYEHIVDIDREKNDLDGALAGAERLVRADPDNARGYDLKADVLFLRGDPQSAIQVRRDVLVRDPESIYALMTIGAAYGILGNFDSLGVVVAEISNSRRPEARALVGAGQAFLCLVQGRFHEGEALAAEAEKEAGGLYKSQYAILLIRLRAEVLFEMGRADEALRECRIAGNLARTFNPHPGTGLAPIAEGLARVGRVQELETLFKEYDRGLGKEGREDEERRMRNYLAGTLALAKGRAKEAVAFFENGAPYGPPLVRDWRRRWSLARALLAAGDKDRAMVELNEVVKRAPGAGDPITTFKAINMLAKLYEERGRREDALALYRRVARQYRQAEPGVKANEEALAGIQRLTKAPS
ncbi:MAG TPA: tetratricopeptide repeat protein, partial [Candidatus Eisenbacteria bacterium]|nr:tetratricopeptide repeat protein [Candidatus Eisenbacteria bacterium]